MGVVTLIVRMLTTGLVTYLPNSHSHAGSGGMAAVPTVLITASMPIFMLETTSTSQTPTLILVSLFSLTKALSHEQRYAICHADSRC